MAVFGNPLSESRDLQSSIIRRRRKYILLLCDGVDIAACGLCLEFYDLKDKLLVGRVSNMLETVETLHSAGRIIRP